MKPTDRVDTSKAAKRRVAGYLAKRAGSEFERLFMQACERNSVAVTRLPDSCKQVGPKRLIRVKSPYDFVCTYSARSAVIDTKTSGTDSFAHSMIDEHQVVEMIPHEFSGAKAGYVVWLRAIDMVIFIPATTLAAAMRVKGSIGHTHREVTLLGSIRTMDMRRVLSSSLEQWVSREMEPK